MAGEIEIGGRESKPIPISSSFGGGDSREDDAVDAMDDLFLLGNLSMRTR